MIIINSKCYNKSVYIRIEQKKDLPIIFLYNFRNMVFF